MQIDYKQLFESIQDPDNISKLAYDKAIDQLQSRIIDIWQHICKTSDRYFNIEQFKIYDSEIGENWTIDAGCIVINKYFINEFTISEGNHWIDLNKDNSCYCYFNSFPSELLWDETWKKTISDHTADAIQKFIEYRKNKLAKNSEKRKAKKEREKEIAKLIPGIEDKIKLALTAEEYKIFLQKWQRKGFH